MPIGGEEGAASRRGHVSPHIARVSTRQNSPTRRPHSADAPLTPSSAGLGEAERFGPDVRAPRFPSPVPVPACSYHCVPSAEFLHLFFSPISASLPPLK